VEACNENEQDIQSVFVCADAVRLYETADSRCIGVPYIQFAALVLKTGTNFVVSRVGRWHIHFGT
jgi:hypothetical protein